MAENGSGEINQFKDMYIPKKGSVSRREAIKMTAVAALDATAKLAGVTTVTVAAAGVNERLKGNPHPQLTPEAEKGLATTAATGALALAGKDLLKGERSRRDILRDLMAGMAAKYLHKKASAPDK